MSTAQDRPAFDPDEDLFDFGVARESEAPESEQDLEEIFASFRDDAVEEELLAVPVARGGATGAAASAPLVASPASEPTSSALRPAHDAPAPHGTRAQGAGKPAAHGRESALEPETAPVAPGARRARWSRLSKGVVAVAFSVTLINSLLALVMLRSGSGEHDVRATGSETPASRIAEEAAQHTGAPGPKSPALPDPEGVGEAHGHPTLDEARAQIARGEYAGARQHVYGLLSIIDRLEDPRRESLEAECQFLIAQSLHLEALERMGAAK